MKRIMIGLVAATASLSLLAGCGSNDPGTQSTGGANSTPTTQGTGGANAGVIKIGINYELSGDVATYGEDATQGVEMAIEEVNAAGGINGKQVELVKYDNKSDAAEATTLATKLMSQDKVLAVIGPATSGNFKATIPVATTNKVPVVSGSATADDVTVGPNGVNEYAFRTCFNDSFQGTAMANYASQKLGAKNVVIIKDNSSDYAKGLAATFTTTFTANGGTIVGEDAYVGGDKDFSAMLTRVRAMSFDAIYLPGYYQEAGLIIKAARDLGITAPVLGADGFDSPVLLDLGGAAALNDVYFTNHYSSLDTDPKVVDFIAAFKAKFNEEPNAFHAGGYDTANFVVDAIKRASAETGEAVKEAMAATTGFEAVTGTLTVDANHNPVKDIVVIELKDGVQASSERIQP